MKIDKNKTYTVTQIADIAGVSKASVSRWLSDRHVSPDHTKARLSISIQHTLNNT